MARQKNELVVSNDTRAMELAAQQQEQKLLSAKEVDDLFLSEGETYNFYVCMQRAGDAEISLSIAFLQLGRQLALIQSHESEQQFLSAAEALNLERRMGYYAVACAKKYKDVQTFAQLDKSKLIVLSVLGEDRIKALAEGESDETLGTLDELSVKPIRQIKDELRKEKEERQKERDVLEAIIRKKESKISELEMEVAGKQPPTKEELAGQSLKELRKQMVMKFATMNTTLDELNRLLAQAQATDGVTLDQLQGLSDGVAEFYSLFDDKYQDFNQDMEYIRPKKKE